MMHCQVPLESFQRVDTASLRDERVKGSEANRDNCVNNEERCTGIGIDNWLDRGIRWGVLVIHWWVR